MEKEQLLSIVKEWVKNDQEIRVLHKEQSRRKLDNKQLSIQLMSVMVQNQIDCFEIKDGTIVYKKRNVKKPMTKKQLFATLVTFFEGDGDRAQSLNHFISEQRTVEVKETVVFLPNERF